MDTNLCPPASKELARKRTQLAPEISAAFKTFSQRVFAGGAYAHANLALETMNQLERHHPGEQS